MKESRSHKSNTVRYRSATAQGVWLLLCASLFGEVHAQESAATPDQIKFFETKIRPVLVEQCYECHAAGAKIVQGGLRVDHREGLLRGGDTGAAIVPGDAEKSSLLAALRYEDVEMPPKGKLPNAVIKDFEAWIAMGAPDPRRVDELPVARTIDLDEGRKHWAFQPVADPQPPEIKDESWPIDTMDRFVLARQESVGLRPVADADRYTWLRRVSLDLTGLPPTPDEIEAFIRDNSPRACETVVDRLLDSRGFGERWARHWMDLTGYADMIGTSNNVFAEHAWRYRDYLIDAFNEDKPFDRFICEQIAGDLLTASSPQEQAENMIATGFLMVGDIEIVEPDKPKMEADHIDTQVNKLGMAFLGMTLGCARCHDHKFDPVGLNDYYGIAGILRSSPSTHKIPFGVWSSLNTTELPETPEQLADRKKIEAQHAEKLSSLNKEQQQLTEAKQRIVDQLATLDRTEAEQNELVAVKQPPASDTQIVTAKVEQTQPEPDASEPMPDKESLAKQRDEIAEKIKKLASEIQHAEFFASKVPKAFAMRDGEHPADMPVYIRGNPYAPGAVMSRSALRVASWEKFPEIPAGQSGRLQLADWLADDRNPLTARVTVNRIWQKLFGEGLVRSVDYFGTRGEVPSHPELLDHLANRFMRNNWSQKQLIRSLVLSRTYRMSSRNDITAMQIDPENKLLWRMNPQRLDAEAIRDSALAISDELLKSQGGPSLVLENVENTGALVQSGVNPPNYNHRKPRPSQEFERTIYLPVMRTGFPGADRIRSYFDFVDPAQIAGKREQSVVPTQSLFLMNNDFFRRRSRSMVEQLLASASTQEERLEQLWMRVLARPMTAVERREAIAFLDDSRSLVANEPNQTATDIIVWQELCHSLMSSNHFVFRL
jgi:flagellar biosynthesis/type III secretory pathway chaperone